MDHSQSKSIFLVSACLIGLCTRYDGRTKASTTCLEFLQNSHYIPVCPEQLGGLPTPRPAADIINGDGFAVLLGEASVCTRQGRSDVSKFFINGANQVLRIAQSQQITSVCLKAKSPSCAVNGTIGVTAALLSKHGFTLHEF